MGEEGFGAEQTEILRGIWQSIKDLGQTLGGRIDETNARLDQTNARLDQTNARLDNAVDRLDALEEGSAALRSAFAQMEMRLATELVEVPGQLVTLIEHLRAHQADSARLNDCEVDIRDLKRRVSSLEGPGPKAGPSRAAGA